MNDFVTLILPILEGFGHVYLIFNATLSSFAEIIPLSQSRSSCCFGHLSRALNISRHARSSRIAGINATKVDVEEFVNICHEVLPRLWG